jgi:hypothetical protein
MDLRGKVRVFLSGAKNGKGDRSVEEEADR